MRELEILIKHLERELEILRSLPESKIQEEMRAEKNICEWALNILDKYSPSMREAELL